MERTICQICNIAKEGTQYRKKNGKNKCRDCVNALRREFNKTEEGAKLQREAKRKYKETHKKEIEDKRKVKVICECGAIVSHHGFKKHTDSPKHKKNMQSK